MTLNGVGSRTRLGLPAGGPRREPLSGARRPLPDGAKRGAAAASWVAAGARDGRARHDLRLHRSR